MLTPLRLVPAPLRRRVIDSAEVPADLATVTTIAADEEHPPSSVGMTQAGVDAIWRATERLYATGMHPGISLVVRRHGKIVLKRAIGHARGNGPGDQGETPVPMTPDTPVCIFSASKAHGGAAAAPVVGAQGTEPARSGEPLPAGVRPQRQARHHHLPAAVPQGRHSRRSRRRASTWRSCCWTATRSCSSSTARHRTSPGTTTPTTRSPRASWSPHWSRRCRGAASVASSASTSAARSGSTSFDFGARGATLQKVARNYVSGFKLSAPVDLYLKRAIGTGLEPAATLSNDPRFYQAVIPAGNGVATADDCSKLFQCLLDGGEFDGVRVLEPLTVRRAVAEVGKPEVDRSLLVPLRYSAGMMLGASPSGLFGPDTSQGVRPPRLCEHRGLGRSRAGHLRRPAQHRQARRGHPHAAAAGPARPHWSQLPETVGDGAGQTRLAAIGMA